MRLFVAVRLSDDMRHALTEVQRELRERGACGRYTPAENLHLTLAFLGEYPDADAVLASLSAAGFAPFEITLDGLGRFGDLWWAGLRPSAPLAALAGEIRGRLAEGEIPFDREDFLPHVTLIRGAAGELPALPVRPASMSVGAFALLRSDFTENGMAYTVLGTVEGRREE